MLFALPYFLAETIYCFFQINSTVTDHTSGFLSSYVSIWTPSPYGLTSPTFTCHTGRDLSYTGDFQRRWPLVLYYLMQVFAVQVALYSYSRDTGFPAAMCETASKRLYAKSCV